MIRHTSPASTRLHLYQLPLIRGHVVIITCQDIALLPFARPIKEATGMPWGTWKTLAGGTRALTANPGPDTDALVKSTFEDILAVEKSKGQPFQAVIDLQHLGCEAHGFHHGDAPIDVQLREIFASQNRAAPLIDRRMPGCARYKLVVDPRTSCWYGGNGERRGRRSSSAARRPGRW